MEHANPFSVILLLLLGGMVIFFIGRAKNGREIAIRRIAGIDAIDEAIGRAVELGRPISFTSGLTGVNSLLYACLGVLRYIARKAARLNSRLFVPCSDAEALVLTDATLQNAYRTEKKFSNYEPSRLRFLSDEQFAFSSGYMGLVHRENVGSAFLIGRFAAESLILAEAGLQIGAVQVAATTSPEQVPFFITACDYTLIGEELYAAGAYLSRDPVQTGSLKAQDYGKALFLALIVLGTIQATYYSISEHDSPIPLKSWMQASWEEIGSGCNSAWCASLFGKKI
ncbi:MAG: hypothetical protein IT291_01195 [Deltaproteobacteria bacterium]|nr:hypothetical protein [Deltaproteobacteria bacterium]